eukprot:600231-Hanusia_phi.AAC.9
MRTNCMTRTLQAIEVKCSGPVCEKEESKRGENTRLQKRRRRNYDSEPQRGQRGIEDGAKNERRGGDKSKRQGDRRKGGRGGGGRISHQ